MSRVVLLRLCFFSVSNCSLSHSLSRESEKNKVLESQAGSQPVSLVVVMEVKINRSRNGREVVKVSPRTHTIRAVLAANGWSCACGENFRIS